MVYAVQIFEILCLCRSPPRSVAIVPVNGWLAHRMVSYCSSTWQLQRLPSAKNSTRAIDRALTTHMTEQTLMSKHRISRHTDRTTLSHEKSAINTSWMCSFILSSQNSSEKIPISSGFHPISSLRDNHQFKNRKMRRFLGILCRSGFLEK